MIFKSMADHIESGTAVDQEAIIKLRPQIEDYVTEHMGPFDRTELYWEMDNVEDYTFNFELHFYKEPEIAFESED